MRILLDTNILIHREIPIPARAEIGVLFRWLDQLHFTKCVHPETVKEVQKLANEKTRAAFNIKLDSYHVLRSQAPLAPEVEAIATTLDKNDNDTVDTALLNELFCGRVDSLLTEDKKIHKKAALLGINDRVFKIDSFLEKVTAENPEFTNYKVLSVKKALFGEINLADPFFDSFKTEYPGFEQWFARKSDEIAYVCTAENGLAAFLYLKVEGPQEPYNDIEPIFRAKKRLKIGTFKVVFNGYKIGERFLKVIFDNAILFGVDEIYVTIFNNSTEQARLISLLQDFGFYLWGKKGDELVLVRDMMARVDFDDPRKTFPFFSGESRAFIVPIYPEYHTSLFPDSILRNESPRDFVEHEPFRNAISKVYVSRSYQRNLKAGDTIVFYRTGGYHHSVATTIGIVESVILNLTDEAHFVAACRKRSVFSDADLRKHWDYNPKSRPFVVNFLYAYSLPRRPNMAELIDLGVIANVNSAPRGFEALSPTKLTSILKAANANDRLIIN